MSSANDNGAMPWDVEQACPGCLTRCRSRWCSLACFVSFIRHVEAQEKDEGVMLAVGHERPES